MDDLADYERRFRRAGLPLFIEGHSARTDVFNRAVPLLALVFLAEVLGAVDLEWSLLANAGALAGGLAIVLVALGLVNRARGRPFASVPRQVGRTELAVFVVVPALLPLVFGGQTTSALVTAAGNALLLVAIYGVVGYGLLSIVRWAAVRLAGQLAASFLLLSRALPLLLIFALVLFVNTEMWQVFATVPDPFLAAIAVLFLAAGTAFLVVRLPREVGAIEREAGGGPPLTTRQRLNVGLVMLVSQGLQVAIVSAAVGAFFVAFGVLAIGPEVHESWIGSTGEALVTLDVLGERAVLTEELMRVSGALAAFSGLYYAIAVLTDSTYREEFLDELTGEMRSTFRARAEYLERRAATPASGR
jgi:hypothetical protein